MPTITIGGNGYASYITEAEADQFLAGDISRAVAWDALAGDVPKRAIVSATRMLSVLPWCEETPDPEDPDLDQVIKDVTAQLACDLATKPKLFADATGNSNIKSVKAGSAQVEFFSPIVGGPPIPLALWNALLNAGLVCLGTMSDGGVPNDGPYVSGISGGCRPLYGRYPWDWPIAAGDYD